MLPAFTVFVLLVFPFGSGWAAQSAVGAGSLQLRLDNELGPSITEPATVSATFSARFDVAELRSRLAQVQDQIAALDAQLDKRSYLVDNGEKRVRELERFLALQDRTMRVLRSQGRQREQRVAEVQKLAIAKAKEMTAQIVATAPSSPAAATASKQRLIIDGALAAVIAVLLGWALYLRSRNATQNAELTDVPIAPAPAPGQHQFATTLRGEDGVFPSNPDSEPEPDPEPESELEPETELEPEMGKGTELHLNSEPELKPKLDLDLDLDLEPDLAPELDLELELEPDPEFDLELEPEAELDSVDSSETVVLGVADETGAESKPIGGPVAEIRADESVEASSGDTHSDAGPTPLSSVDLDVGGELDGQAGEDVSEQAAQSEDDAVFEYAAQDADTKTADHAPSSAAGPALGDGASASEDASPLAPIADEAGDSPLDGSGAVAQHRTADQQVLREVDTYMAFECYQEAELLLDELMRTNPGNPEYHLRLLHIQSAAGDLGKAEEEEQILAAMMDGPLSETIGRVKEIGRGLMPGHHLFEDDAQIEEAKRIIAEESNRQPAQAGPLPSSGSEPGQDTLDKLFANESGAGSSPVAEGAGELDFNSTTFDLEPDSEKDEQPRPDS